MNIVSSLILVAVLASDTTVGAFIAPKWSSPCLSSRGTVAAVHPPPTPSTLFLSDDNKPSFDISNISGAASRTVQELLNYDIAKVVDNTNGDVGQRGEAYFLAQAALIVCIVIGGVPIVGGPLQAVLGPLLLVSGLLIGVLSVVDLGSDSLSPYPKPLDSGNLKTTGVYAQMRHPMYTAVMTVMLGLSVVTNSADRLLLTTFLYFVLEVKSDKEEIFLTEFYGSDYTAYQVRTMHGLHGVTTSDTSVGRAPTSDGAPFRFPVPTTHHSLMLLAPSLILTITCHHFVRRPASQKSFFPWDCSRFCPGLITKEKVTLTRRK